MSKIKIICFSDTHSRHMGIRLPECDIAIFAGDESMEGGQGEVESFMKWYNQQPAKFKLFICGNHSKQSDSKFDKYTFAKHWWPQLLEKYSDLIYLENEYIQIMGLNIWGSPITPDYYPEFWAHNRSREEEIDKIWKQIPQDTDIVITHGPPLYIGDTVSRDGKVEFVGCKELAYRIEQIKPKLHVFGHIHGSAGLYPTKDTLYVNASICDEGYKPVNKPIELEYDTEEKIFTPMDLVDSKK